MKHSFQVFKKEWGNWFYAAQPRKFSESKHFREGRIYVQKMALKQPLFRFKKKKHTEKEGNQHNK